MDKSVARAVNVFSARCDELISSNFILADKKISAVLKAVAGSEFLFKLVQNCLEEFDYEGEKERRFVQNGSRFALDMPSEPDKLIAFTFRLLLDFDNKEMDLHKFLQTFFYEDGSYFESFSSFCKIIIVPFKFTVRDIAKALLESEREKEEEEKSTTADALIGRSAAERVIKLASEDRAAVNSSKYLSETDKKELSEITDGFISAVKTMEKGLVRVMFLSYKHSLKNIKKLRANADKIAEILEENNMI